MQQLFEFKESIGDKACIVAALELKRTLSIWAIAVKHADEQAVTCSVPLRRWARQSNAKVAPKWWHA